MLVLQDRQVARESKALRASRARQVHKETRARQALQAQRPRSQDLQDLRGNRAAQDLQGQLVLIPQYWDPQGVLALKVKPA